MEVRKWKVQQREDGGHWITMEDPVWAANEDDAYVCARLCYPILAAHGRLRVK